MLSSARHLHGFPEQRSAGGAHGVTARLSNAAAGGNRLLAQALEALHGWQVRQAEREIHRYRRSVRSSSNGRRKFASAQSAYRARGGTKRARNRWSIR